ncbi:GNAT family N-acetyltransferase [Staphylococcus caprae]|uniref:GNAT family N-acetyltransferase n=1 Tax=Staphylococcus caprae TaxID=29380 RepID=UPI001C8359EB|nr:GNAT family N-acetyltransferase [Staphylococcus caprae]MBX5320247.1 GNAT family N-acetyltransferase [Staphylococcus caprae]MDI9231114.1 GNAT family N-acetyltransferase [Staphylococcus caprae]
MVNIQVVPAHPSNKKGGKLTHFAIDEMAKVILGETSKNRINCQLQKLWKKRGNRFNHDISYVAKEDDRVLGTITCASLVKIEKSMVKTVLEIIKMKKLKALKIIFSNPKKLYSLITMDEGNKDEFHISMLATLPEARGKGVGTRLLNFAEKKAQKEGFNKLSLTVVKDNDKALNLYKKFGFSIVGEINKSPFYLYQMRKNI